jgi:transcription elongation factor Elf1
MRKIYCSDHLEEMKIAETLTVCGIKFVHESENKAQELDFYLPFFDVYIEVKLFHADRISRQMKSKENVIAIQGA